MTTAPMLPQLPAAPSASNPVAAVSANAPRGEAAPNPFDQHLQAARNAPPTSQPAQDDAASTQAAAKPAQESGVSTTAATPTTPAAGAQAAAAPRGQADATLLQAALAAAQGAPATAGTDPVAEGAASKTATPSKTETPDETAAATLAGAMLAMLGQVTGGMPAASADTDDATVAADGSASGQAKAAVMPQRLVLDEQAAAAAVAATPTANLVGVPGDAMRALASAAADTRKDRGLEALALATAPAATPAPAAPTPTLPQLQLSSPPGSTGFADELGQQVAWLGQQDIQQAKIRLHPQDLGSLDVQLSVSHNRVDVVFSAQHPAAVAAVQQSLPQLDNMLARHGLSLGHAEVGQQQNRGDERGRGEGRAATATDEIGEAHGAVQAVATSRVGLLDTFA